MTHEAILLVGPTGSGKTPLGELLEARGLGGGRCVHFDFGEQLRHVAQAAPSGFTADEITFVRSVLESGALLEDEHFPIAEKILRGFIEDHAVGEADRVVLNGLPRHVGQAADVGRIVDVQTVLSLSCTPAVVFERIKKNSGGDRADRLDDDESAVVRKLEIYRDRIAPLLAYYRNRGAAVVTIDVGVTTTPAEMAAMI